MVYAENWRISNSIIIKISEDESNSDLVAAFLAPQILITIDEKLDVDRSHANNTIET